jgi:plasmid stability protein
MSALTIPQVNDTLRRKLEERARTNHRSVEDEALCCLQEAVDGDEEILNSIPADRWKEIEDSVAETIHDRGTALFDADFQRFRELARGRNR